MWAPIGETVSYIDNSSVQAVDYHWFIPGADATGWNLRCRRGAYNTSGIYLFPTMTVKDGRGNLYLSASGKLGQERRVCTLNMLNNNGCQRSGYNGCIGQRPFDRERIFRRNQ
ncbi:MAG: hypothetical protein ACLRTD_10415 [Bacteroides sp.]